MEGELSLCVRTPSPPSHTGRLRSPLRVYRAQPECTREQSSCSSGVARVKNWGPCGGVPQAPITQQPPSITNFLDARRAPPGPQTSGEGELPAAAAPEHQPAQTDGQ